MMNYKWCLMVMGQYMIILAGTWSVLVSTAWYHVVQGQHRAYMPLYIWGFGLVTPMPQRQTDNRI